MNRYSKFFVQTSTLSPNMYLNLTKHGRFHKQSNQLPTKSHHELGLNEIIGATRTIEGSAYWIALVVNWMQTLGSQPVMPKISPIIGTRGLPKP